MDGVAPKGVEAGQEGVSRDGFAGEAFAGEGFLETRQLVKRFDGAQGAVAVDEVSLSIRKGEIFALLGSSGCGKSTLLRMLAGFEKPTSGSVILNGVDIGQLPPYERPINMMFQSYALFPHLSVWDNIAFGLKREGMPRDRINARVDEMLKLVQLGELAKRKPHQLSGGQQQRVALARSLAKKPQLLLLDEPLGALDKKLRQQTQFELMHIIESVGVTCVMVTHDQEEAMTMASRIAVMSRGRVLQVGTPKEIYEFPNCRFVADFIGNINLFEGRLTVDEVDRCEVAIRHGLVHVGHGISGTLAACRTAAVDSQPTFHKSERLLDMALAVAVRPEKIQLSKDKPGVAHNLFTGTVREIAYFGSYSSYLVEMAHGQRVKIAASNTSRGDGGHTRSAGDIVVADAVYFWWDDTAAAILTQ